MPLPLANRTVLVTGASSGIGKAVALHLADRGARVVFNHLGAAEAAAAAAAEASRLGGAGLAIEADVTDRAAVEAMVAEAAAAFGPIDVLVNNVGGLIERRPFVDVDEALWDRLLALNLKSAYLCARAVLPGMIATGGGQIVNITSIAADTGGPGGTIAYAVAKGGLETLTIGLARELAPNGIRVNAVSPGLIATPFHAGNERSFSERVAAIPQGRMGEPEEVARVVGFLVSDAASYVTGQIWAVAGGR